LYDLKNNPYSRRIMTNVYVHQDLHEMNLYPCAYSMTFNVTREKYDPAPGSPAALGRKPETDEAGTCLVLNAVLNQRSNDVLTANNWNVAQYAILLMMMAQVSGMMPGELVHMIADAHIYDRHVDAVKEIIRHEPKPAPKFIVDPAVDDFYKFTRDSFRMEGYEYSDFAGKIPVAL
jgi:thymidylate synthase